MTYVTYRYINRGLFERDKTTFKLMMCLKIMIKAGNLSPADVGVLLKAGSGISDSGNKYRLFINDKQWNNIVALSNHKFNGETAFFSELQTRIGRVEKEWKAFLAENEPEIA